MILFNKQRLFYTLILVVFTAVQISCSTPATKEKVAMDIMKENIIPQPVSMEATNSSFELTAESDIYVDAGSEAAMSVAQYLADKLNPSTGLGLEAKPTNEAPDAGNIYLTISGADTQLGEEGYNLTIAEEGITLSANTPAGLFYGVQTIRQLLPAKAAMNTAQEGPWLVATGIIKDQPAYEYRGVMLDVSRHFFSVEDVKRYIDLIALYKMNAMHLHLSDDQGWRIEIKSWPNLTAHGGSTQVGGGEGGFYTQEQYKDIVKYAQERHIIIVPEIDMPGHTNAALASYAELNCDGKATELYTGTEVGFSTFCTDKEITYKFIDDVVREISEMTPGPYFHIGGDESHVTPMEDYIPFVNKVQEIVAAHGKKVLGWDEIANASLQDDTFVQFWADVENTTNGVNQGAKVLMSPAKKIYLDMQYDSTTHLGLHWAAYIEVDSAYAWEPTTYVPGIGKENILGIEAPIWSETITNMDELEFMVFPRLPGVAEIAWSPVEKRSWDEYKVRLGAHGPLFKALGIDYYASKLVPWKTE